MKKYRVISMYTLSSHLNPKRMACGRQVDPPPPGLNLGPPCGWAEQPTGLSRWVGRMFTQVRPPPTDPSTITSRYTWTATASETGYEADRLRQRLSRRRGQLRCGWMHQKEAASSYASTVEFGPAPQGLDQRCRPRHRSLMTRWVGASHPIVCALSLKMAHLFSESARARPTKYFRNG